MSFPRVAIVCDFREENWPSMNLVADMLLHHLERDHAGFIAPTRICPPMRRRFTRDGNGSGALFNADRVVNRFWDYPRLVRERKAEFDLFHVVDHSYGQLLHQLPPERTIITCHDTDTFQCLVGSPPEPRSIFFKGMVKRILSGLRKAARVTCPSHATREQLLAHGFVQPERAVVVPNGLHPAYSSEPERSSDEEAERVLGLQRAEAIDILHVGSTIPRKRIDILLRVFAALRKQFFQARLIRVGGPFTTSQTALLEQLDLTESVIFLPSLERSVLAAVYRRAALLLQPSDREGFGLPVIEAMACGTPVVASDLPVLREVGGVAASYCPVADVPTWSQTIGDLLTERDQRPEKWSARRASGLAQAANFSWAEHTQKMVALYQEILESGVGSRESGVGSGESGVGSQESGVRSQKSFLATMAKRL